MTGAEAVAQIQQGIGWRSDLATEILATLNFAQDEVEKPGMTLPEFLKTEALVTASDGNQEIPVSSNFIKEVEFKSGALRYQGTATSRTFFLEKMSRMDAEKYFYGDWRGTFDPQVDSDIVQSGIPRAYVLYQSVIRIYPIPDQDYTLQWSYYQHDSDIENSATTNNWLTYHPWLIVGGAGWKIASDIQNQAAMQKFAQLRMDASRALIASVVEREIAGRRFALGSRL